MAADFTALCYPRPPDVQLRRKAFGEGLVMVYSGTIQNGVVVFDNGNHPPDGTPVQVVPLPAAATSPSAPGAPSSPADVDPIFRMSELAADTGVPDLARNIDHYLYGHPKQSDGK